MLISLQVRVLLHFLPVDDCDGGGGGGIVKASNVSMRVTWSLSSHRCPRSFVRSFIYFRTIVHSRPFESVRTRTLFWPMTISCSTEQRNRCIIHSFIHSFIHSLIRSYCTNVQHCSVSPLIHVNEAKQQKK